MPSENGFKTRRGAITGPQMESFKRPLQKTGHFLWVNYPNCPLVGGRSKCFKCVFKISSHRLETLKFMKKLNTLSSIFWSPIWSWAELDRPYPRRMQQWVTCDRTNPFKESTLWCISCFFCRWKVLVPSAKRDLETIPSPFSEKTSFCVKNYHLGCVNSTFSCFPKKWKNVLGPVVWPFHLRTNSFQGCFMHPEHWKLFFLFS